MKTKRVTIQSNGTAAEMEGLRPLRLTPDQYTPQRATDLIGEACGIATRLLKSSWGKTDNIKLLLFGAPGCGKTSIMRMLCRELAAHEIDVEKINGRNLTIDVVREWERNAYYASLFGGWKIKHIEEVDLVAQLAQDLMLTYLDDLPTHNAVIGTSNLSLETLTERFQTRFQLIQLHGPSNDELARWLVKRWKVPKQTAEFIAIGASGNVREALLAARGFQMFGKIEHRPRTPTVVKDPAAVARAKKAWLTMRSRSAAR